MGLRSSAVGVAVMVTLAACSGSDAPPQTPPDPATPEPVEFTTADGVELDGLLFNPPVAEGVVMAHQQDGSMDDFADLAVDLARNGIAVLTFDFRGATVVRRGF